jgi:hypothetical protein
MWNAGPASASRSPFEPEPCCFLETTDESIAFFKNTLLKPETLDTLGAVTGVSQQEAETLLRRHLGICYDVCHGAVEYEDIVAGLDRLLAAGIAIPKIQLSAAMRVPAMKKDLVAAVMKYNDGVYLHQSIVRHDESLVRHVDLPDAVAAFGDGKADGEWRIHCHVPVFLADLGEISSTRSDLVKTLAALRQKTRSSHLEVETYTGMFCRTSFEPAPSRPTSPVRSRSASRNSSDECCCHAST